MPVLLYISNFDTMKKFIFKIIVLFLVVALVDFIVGGVLDYCVVNSRGGAVQRNNYILNRTKEKCLFFGSSKSSHHYVPAIIKDSLGIDAFNCGQDGNGIYYAYPVICSILKRYVPEYIIYDIKPEFDLYKYQTEERYISSLKMFYGKYPAIDSIVNAIDPTQKIKMCSNLYRYNSMVTAPIMGMIKSSKFGIDGYLPLYGTFSGEVGPVWRGEYDRKKIELLKKLVNKCREYNVKLFFVVSPSLYKEDINMYKPIMEIAESNQIPFLFEGNDLQFVGKKELFRDPPHLNDTGAKLFTQKLAMKLKLYM